MSITTNVASSMMQTEQPSRLLTPKTQPIPLLSSPIARTSAYTHTASVLLYYYLRAGALVADPLQTLLLDIVPIATTQALFCAACLPAAGNWYSGTGDAGRGGKIIDGSATSGKKGTGASVTSGARRRPGVSGTPSKNNTAKGFMTDSSGVVAGSPQSRILPVVLSLILTIALAPVPLAVLALILGAPLYPTSLLPHTFVLSIHVSLLAILPLFYTHGVSIAAWQDVAAAWLPFDEAGVWAGSVGCLVGGWIGAVPMALDWDREWQKWPCTVVWGAVVGWAAGRLLTGGLRLGIGRRINMSEGTADTLRLSQESSHVHDQKSR